MSLIQTLALPFAIPAAVFPSTNQNVVEFRKEHDSYARGDCREIAEKCLAQTANALHENRGASASALSQSIEYSRESIELGKPVEMLEVLARIQAHTEEQLGEAILNLGNKVAATLAVYPPVIPFSNKLIAPSAFYDAFERIHKLARILLTPVIYAEDTDAIGIASINPVAALLVAEEIRNSVFKRVGIRPFISVTRLDYESWTLLTRKHFEL